MATEPSTSAHRGLLASRRQTSSSSMQPGHTQPSVNAFSPLEFCEILHAYWLDRSGGTLVHVPGDGSSKKRKAKGKATPSGSAAGTAAGPKQKRRLIREGKSFYVKVDLAASHSCVRHIQALQSDEAIRREIDKLVSLAQTSSASSASSQGSGNPAAPDISGSPSKRHFRTAQQILHADARAETLERRVYLRLLLSRTILRYIEKHTGCKYIYRGDRVTHYRDPTDEDDQTAAQSADRTEKKARCTFWYECASGEYEQPACGGTLRIVVDLDLASSLVKKHDGELDSQDDQEARSLNDSGSSDDSTTSSHKKPSPPATNVLPRTPATRFYGSRARHNNLLSSIPLSSRSTKQITTAARVSNTDASTSISGNDPQALHLTPFVVALRLTHIKAHREQYSVLRAKYKESRLQGTAKLERIQQKLDKLCEELESLRDLQMDKDELYERGLDRFWDKIKRASTPTESDSGSESSPGEEEDELEVQEVAVGDADTVIANEGDDSSSSSSEREQETVVFSPTAKTQPVRNNTRLPQDRSNQDNVNKKQASKPRKDTDAVTSSSKNRSLSRPTAVRNVPAVASSEEVEVDETDAETEAEEEEPETSIRDATRDISGSTSKKAKAQLGNDSFSSAEETDYSEPDAASTRVKRRRNSGKGDRLDRSPVEQNEQAIAAAEEAAPSASRGRGRQTARRGGARRCKA